MVRRTCWTNVKTEVSDLKLKAESAWKQQTLCLFACSSLQNLQDNFDLEDIVDKHEFASWNVTLMKPDGFLLPSTNKSILTHEHESIAATSQTREESINQGSLT